MRQANLGAVRPFATAAVLVLLAAPTFGQVVEKGRTFADLTASHPCTNGLTERIARVIDCDAADDVGDGGGAFQCWVRCDGSAPWETVAIGAGGGSLPGADEVTEAMLKSVNGPTDEYMLTYESTTGDFEWQAPATGTIGGSTGATDDALVCADGTGGATVGACTVGNLDNLRLDGNTISSTDANGNIVLAPNGTGRVIVPHGSLTAPGISVPGNNATGFHIVSGGTESLNYVINGVPVLFSSAARVRLPGAAWLGWISSTDTNANEVDAYFTRAAAGIVKITSTLNLALLASPPRTCDATAEGDIYSDTSHALCWCDASAWQKLSGAGTCA